MLIILVLHSIFVGFWLGILLDSKYLKAAAMLGHIIGHGDTRYRVTITTEACTCIGCQTRIGNGGV